MDLKFWKHKEKKEIIAPACYAKLPDTHKHYYEPTHEEPTHHVDDGNDFLTTIIAAELVSSVFDSGSDSGSSSFDSGNSDSSSFGDSGGFGGGDSGGAGAGGDY